MSLRDRRDTECMEKKCIQNLDRESEVRLGRPGRRWKDNIKMDLMRNLMGDYELASPASNLKML
jgi:hypothetical protein